ncbi:hypothetical protein K438DRAFT_1763797 [Mycena galopus ATCC 62051]|nr:hypothetical protein K438DRAFT_1779600 [Mycena galopus ATCC 62051]KAF8189595.1 hypothetical protein K438DRAFT_1763797 [Mycena galopus ATCC 62051]
MSDAQATVMSLPELLERTLEKLPMRDLLVTAPLVSRTWRAITFTPALQRVLFFQPAPSSSMERVQNTLLAEVFPAFFAPESSCWSWPNAKTLQSMPWSKAPDAFRRPEASWRRMLVTQPPVHRLLVTETARGVRPNGPHSTRERRAVLDLNPSEPGLRMGVLYDVVPPLIDRVASAFCVRWHEETDFFIGREPVLAVPVLAVVCLRIPPVQEVIEDIREEFYSEGTERVEIDFGEWCPPESFVE